jgi:rhodanese-related sulfurtransferase
MKKILILLLTCIMTTSCKSQTSNNFQSLTALAFKEKLNTEKNSQILDVRTPEEFATGHLENAVNINWNSENFDQQIKKFNKTKPIFVNCQAGGRSKKAAERLFSLGFKKIFELKSGINDWISNNFLTVK